jgi:hypothetical protein
MFYILMEFSCEILYFHLAAWFHRTFLKHSRRTYVRYVEARLKWKLEP